VDLPGGRLGVEHGQLHGHPHFAVARVHLPLSEVGQVGLVEHGLHEGGQVGVVGDPQERRDRGGDDAAGRVRAHVYHHGGPSRVLAHERHDASVLRIRRIPVTKPGLVEQLEQSLG